MKYYARVTTKREAINRFGKLGYVPYVEMLKTNKPAVLDEMNKGKRIKFTETTDKKLIAILRKGAVDTVISIREKEV